jgi:hypothetical protein
MNQKTIQIIEKHIGDMLTANDINIAHAAMCLEFTFGKEIHTHIENFIAFAEKNGIDEGEIAMTLAHDVGGALRNDKLMLPRVSSF